MDLSYTTIRCHRSRSPADAANENEVIEVDLYTNCGFRLHVKAKMKI